MSQSPLPADGLIAFVKRACPTCTLIEGEMRAVANKLSSFAVVSQDDPQFPSGVHVIDDTALDHSWLNQIEATPTLISYAGGLEVERVVGWDRGGWQRLTGIADLGRDLPAARPG
jgi:hypothetical protein